MRRRLWLGLAAALAVGLPLFPQPVGMGGCCAGGCLSGAGRSKIELKGKVARVQVSPGEGMPFVEVNRGEQVTRVYLGSMRYLMAEGFNPKVDDAITVQAYRLNDDVVAISVTLTRQRKTLQLRDEKGCPVWRGGRRQ